MTAPKSQKPSGKDWLTLIFAVFVVASFGFLVGFKVAHHATAPTTKICVALEPGACPADFRPLPTATVTVSR